MDRTTTIGYRIASLRVLAGLTQQQLADRLPGGRTKQYVSQVENGTRLATDRRDRVFEFAAALGVSPGDLTGQPFRPANRTDLEQFLVVPQIRMALEEPDEPIQLRSIQQLSLITDNAMTARMNCDMPALGQHLPGLLAETRYRWFEQGDDDAAKLLVKAAVTGALALKANGWVDLALRLAELAETVATSLGDPVSVAAARFTVAQVALAIGGRARSSRIATIAADDLSRVARRRLPDSMLNQARGWITMLHLHAALSDAGLSEGDPAGHLAAAEVAARSVQGNPWFMEANLSNVNLWRVGAELEGPEPGRAVELARNVDVNGLITPQRRWRLHYDTARGHAINGDRDAAVRSMLAAEQAAPGDLRQRAPAIDIVLQFMRDAPVRGGSEPLARLALLLGIDPLAPADA